MKITRNELRHLIKEAVEQKQAIELEKRYDQLFDKAELAGADFLEDLADEMKTLAEKQNKNLDEVDPITLGAGFAAALPVLMKGVEKLILSISKGLKGIDNLVIGRGRLYDAGENLDQWADWWAEKSEDLHHAYIGGIEKIIDVVCFISRKNPSKESRHKAAKAIWTMIVAYLMVKSGIGVLKAVGHHAYGLAGLEGTLASIKAGEIGIYLSEVFEALLSAGTAVAVAT